MTVQMKESGVDWLGRVPAHWGVVRSRRLFRERNEKANKSDLQLTVSQKYGLLPQAEFMEKEGRRIVVVQKGHDILKRTMPGDFVISMRSFQGGLEISEYEGSVSSAYVPLVPIKWVVPRYFRWVFKSITYIQALQSTSDLVRDGQALRFENFSKIPLPAVPIEEQSAIADFLDRSTARIDALVAKKTRFVELLREKRQALITHAVTKGLDASVPMKESGMEWVGAIPSHWEVRPFYSFATEVDSPNTGLKERNLLSLSYGQLVRKDMDRLEGLTPASFEGYNIIEPNDIVFRLTDLQNDQRSLRSARAQERGIITSAYITVRPKASPRFFEYLMRSYDTSKVFYGIGGGIRQSMKFADLKRLPVVVPPISEMDAIASHLDRATTRIDTLITKTERSIELLREKRTALITAAVTGKLDLRPAA